MNDKARLLTPAGFGIALICFVLPFATLSCQGKEVATLSGLELAFGKSLDASALPMNPSDAAAFQEKSKEEQEAAMMQVMGAAQAQAIGANPWAIAAALCAAIGIGAALLGGRTAGIVPAGLAGLGALLLFVAKTRVEGQVSGPTMGMGQVAWNAGFWLCLAAFAVNAAFNAYLATAEPKVVRDSLAPRGAGPPRPFRGESAPVGRAYPTFGEEVPPPFPAGAGPRGELTGPCRSRQRAPIPVPDCEPVGSDRD